MDNLKTRRVEGYLYVNFLKRAEQCLNSAKTANEKQDWAASAICSVHSAISAADALCVHFLKAKHAGQDHKDAVKLLASIKSMDREKSAKISGKLTRILGMKSMVEYEERLVKPREAERLLNDAESVLEYAKSELPKQ